MSGPSSFDPVWEEIYGRGEMLNRYPFDCVVTFVHRFRPRAFPPAQVRVLEIGCGTGNNLWFAAREGFQVAGIDGSASAIGHARHRFAAENLSGDLLVGDFTNLPFEDENFDLAIDRCALTCCAFSDAARAVAELKRVLKPGGRAFFNVYSRKHHSFTVSEPGLDGLRTAISGGSLQGVGGICFYDHADLERVFTGWKFLQVQHLEIEDLTSGEPFAEWRLVLENNA